MRKLARRAANLGVLAIFLIAQFGALSHMVRTRHIVCDEHGEVMDAPLVGDHDAAGGLAFHSVGNQTTGHEHCVLDGYLHHGTANQTTALVPVAILTPTIEPSIAGSADVAARSTAIYRLAPKTSPPLV